MPHDHKQDTDPLCHIQIGHAIFLHPVPLHVLLMI